jgi:tRNA-dihydrouridine synthase 3
MERPNKIRDIVQSMSSVLTAPLTVKMRTGKRADNLVAHTILPQLADWGAVAATLHGRTREQRYTRAADWNYIRDVAAPSSSVPLIGNGDIFTWQDAERAMAGGKVEAVMVARGALVKPWIFTEIKERRHWDISSSERFAILQDFVRFGLEQWGSDDQGVLTTRKFLLEWISFLHRYVPVGLIERPDVGCRLNLRPPKFYVRDELETLMRSPEQCDWFELVNRLLPVNSLLETQQKAGFTPSSISNAYSDSAVVRG